MFKSIKFYLRGIDGGSIVIFIFLAIAFNIALNGTIYFFADNPVAWARNTFSWVGMFSETAYFYIQVYFAINAAFGFIYVFFTPISLAMLCIYFGSK